MSEILHAYNESGITCILYADGRFTVNGIEQPWYKDERTGKPWLVRKRRNFVSLVKQSIREGDYADLT